MFTRPSRTVTLWLLLALAPCLAAPALAEVKLNRKGDKLDSFTLTSGLGKSRIDVRRKLWSNTYAMTESGKSLALIDPFFYNIVIRLADGAKAGGYWNKPEIFDLWLVEPVKDPKRPEASIVKILAAPPGWGVRKEVSIAVEPNVNQAYVCNRLTAKEDLSLAHDREVTYLSYPGRDYVLIIDGKEVKAEPKKFVPINEYVLFQHKKSGAGAAIVFLDRKAQLYPGHLKRRFGGARFHITEKQKGVTLGWDKGSGKMRKGETREQRYIVVWGDGDLKQRVADLSKKALAGELNEKVYELK